jgi:hypothetical protein
MSPHDPISHRCHTRRFSRPIAGVDSADNRTSGICDVRGTNPMKFPVEVEWAPIKTVVASLWACFKRGDRVCDRLGDYAAIWDFPRRGIRNPLGTARRVSSFLHWPSGIVGRFLALAPTRRVAP